VDLLRRPSKLGRYKCGKLGRYECGKLGR